jgi:hypothetical protein
MGTLLREVIFDIGRRHARRRIIQGRQIGGPSGGALRKSTWTFR